MSTVLSQEEIDALLSAISSGDETDPSPSGPAKGEVRPYDFRDANKFPKEQIRTLNSVFDNFAQMLASQLTSVMRAATNAKILSIEETNYFNFSNSIPDLVVLGILSMAPLEGSVLLMVSSEIAYSMINHIFGGSSSQPDVQKPFTEIELVVIERIIHQFMGLLDEAWRKVVDVDASLERIETSAQFAQIVALNEPVAIVTMQLEIGGTTGLINFCIPHLAIEPVAQQLSTKLWFTGSSHRRLEPRGEDIQRRIGLSEVTLSVQFNQTPALVRDILSLQVGDVVRLNHSVDKCVNVTVEGAPKYSGIIGVRGAHYAVQIADIIQKEGDDE